MSSQQGVTPQLYADNLKCTTVDGRALLEAARNTDNSIGAVGQEASPRKCFFSALPNLLGRRCEIGQFLLVTEVGVLNLMFVTWADLGEGEEGPPCYFQ